ncbi:MAG: ABC transporter permease subunit [Planctomycetes bacterium]|nr:ABC transporter permease subunit [Planctomycetota bacterium]
MNALRRPFPLGPRGQLLVAFAVAGALSYWFLGLSMSGLLPAPGAADQLGAFFGAALHPAVDYEASWVPEGAPPFLANVGRAMIETLLLAAAAMSFAILLSIPLALWTSTSFWQRQSRGAAGIARKSKLGRALLPFMRLVIACMRSVHELLWAVVLLAAFGDHHFLAVLAIAIPFAGTLAKVYSEMLDEAPTDSSEALAEAGLAPGFCFALGRLPRALPDMTAYTFYRFECAVRSSAVMGFFGFPTIGYYLKLSYENLYYREVWTWLYALIVLVLVFEAWSAKLRRRWVAR